ncbi:hypothetical protein MJO28_008738, partial [Puccinia striiformis f. sp. tritici]
SWTIFLIKQCQYFQNSNIRLSNLLSPTSPSTSSTESMLGQLNPGQTRIPLASLDFGDRDLIVGFTDVRDETHSSISGFGHPRGSTPISALSSRRSTTSTALSGESPESRRVLPKMSTLLDFIDNDNTNPFPQTSSSNCQLKKSGSH